MNASEKPGDLPDFLIVGAQKCGTSALRYNLNEHTGISMPVEELHFFDNREKWQKGLDWYRQHFPDAGMLQGEKTPEYMSSNWAPKRIAQAIPSVKIIMMLRDPVSRAYSHWNHMMQKIEVTEKRGWELLPFGDAIARALEGDMPYQRLLDKGVYIDQVQKYAEYFPREQIYIGIQERFWKNGSEELAGVFRFLGVEEQPVRPVKDHVRRYDGPMTLPVWSKLTRYYTPFNKRLFEYLGEEIAEWSSP